MPQNPQTPLTPTLTQLLPTLSTLTPTEKFQLIQLILIQLAQETQPNPTQSHRHPLFPTPKSLRGCLKQYAKPELIDQEQNIWQTAVIEKHQHLGEKS